MTRPGRNGNMNQSGRYVGWSQSDREELGILRTRLGALEQDVGNVLQAISALSTKFEERGRIPWQALGVMLAVLIALGGLVYWPIREGQSRIETSIADQSKRIEQMGDKFVTIRELESRAARTAADLKRLNDDENALEKITVPRGEHEEKWRSNDRQMEGHQRQIDDIKKAFGETFSLRDALLQMQRRIDSLEIKSRSQ